MSISSVLSSVVFSSAATPALGVQSDPRVAPVAAQPVARINDSFAAAQPASAPTVSLSALATPRGASALARGAKSSSVPTLSADDYLDLQQSANALCQSVEAAGALSAMRHATNMAILRNLAK